jgi:hypothetical protein
VDAGTKVSAALRTSSKTSVIARTSSKVSAVLRAYSKFVRTQSIAVGVFVLVAQTFPISAHAASDSDWVDDGVNEFSLPRPAEENSPEPVSPEEQASPFSIVRPPKRPQQRTETPSRGDEIDEPSFVPPSDAPVKDVSDTGGLELGPNGQPRKTRPPLEVGISTWQKREGSDGSGVDQRSERLLAQSPMLATPKIINADPKAFKAWLSATNPGVLENARKDQIIEIKGEWDDSAHALRTFGLPYTRVTAKNFSEVNLQNTKIVVVNCEGHLPNEAIMSLRRFVSMGGFLLTTDWALENVVQRAFPGTIQWNEGYYTDGTQNHIVDAVIVGQDPDLVAGTPPVGHWQLVKKSQIVRILKPDQLKVIARSRTMREDPSGLGILAVSFSYGAGRILHLVGHFDNNSELAFNTALPDVAPGLPVSLRQAIAANFIATALKQGAPAAPASEQ